MLYREIILACSQIHTKQIHAGSGIRTLKPSQRAAADLRLRQRGHRDRPLNVLYNQY